MIGFRSGKVLEKDMATVKAGREKTAETLNF